MGAVKQEREEMIRHATTRHHLQTERTRRRTPLPRALCNKVRTTKGEPTVKA